MDYVCEQRQHLALDKSPLVVIIQQHGSMRLHMHMQKSKNISLHRESHPHTHTHTRTILVC